MVIELSTDQLRRLAEDGSIRLFKAGSEQYLEISREDLDISLTELASGKEAQTSKGTRVRY